MTLSCDAKGHSDIYYGAKLLRPGQMTEHNDWEHLYFTNISDILTTFVVVEALDAYFLIVYCNYATFLLFKMLL